MGSVCLASGTHETACPSRRAVTQALFKLFTRLQSHFVEKVDLERNQLHLSNGQSVPLPQAQQALRAPNGPGLASASTQPSLQGGQGAGHAARPAATAYHSAVTSPTSSRQALENC